MASVVMAGLLLLLAAHRGATMIETEEMKLKAANARVVRWGDVVIVQGEKLPPGESTELAKQLKSAKDDIIRDITKELATTPAASYGPRHVVVRVSLPLTIGDASHKRSFKLLISRREFPTRSHITTTDLLKSVTHLFEVLFEDSHFYKMYKSFDADVILAYRDASLP